MSRFGEKKGVFGDSDYQCYYKAQAPPGGKSSISFGGPEEPAPTTKKPVTETQPAPNGDTQANNANRRNSDSTESKENTPRDSNFEQTDPNLHKNLAKQHQRGNNIFGTDSENRPKRAETDHLGREPILPKAQLDMKTNEYPVEKKVEPAAGGVKTSVKVRQPPGGASSGLW